MRRRLTWVVVLAVSLALVALSVGAYLVLAARLESAADQSLAARADAVIATLATQDGTIAMLDTPADDALDAGVWVVDEHGSEVVRAPGSAALQQAVSALAAGGAQATADVPGPARLLARPFVLAGGVGGMVVVSESLVPFQQTERDALGAIVIFGLVVLLLTLLGTRAFLHLALRPVARMTAQAQDWSEHDPERRFAMGPAADELTALAATLDGLLTRSVAALRYEQRLTAEIAHELRTPLTRASVVTELALRRPRPEAELRAALEAVGMELRSTADTLDALLQAAAPGGPRGVGDPVAAAQVACDEARRLPGAASIAVDVEAADGVPLVGCDTPHVVRTLAPLLDNAIHAARSRVVIRVTTGPDDEVSLAVADDGPGLDEEEARRVLEPGVRGRAAESRVGFGLGLALAVRLARAAGGRVIVVPGSAGLVEVRLPAVSSREVA